MRKLLVAALVVLSINAAQAKHYHHRHHHHYRHHHHEHVLRPVQRAVSHGGLFGLFSGYSSVPQTGNGRPSVCYGIPWCGCWLRIQLGIRDTRYNLASWWHNYGHRVFGPVVGAIARLNHHVGLVVGVTQQGDPVIKSGNHNHRVETSVYSKRRIIEYRKA